MFKREIEMGGERIRVYCWPIYNGSLWRERNGQQELFRVVEIDRIEVVAIGTNRIWLGYVDEFYEQFQLVSKDWSGWLGASWR